MDYYRLYNIYNYTDMKKVDYRHFIYIVLLIGSLVCTVFLFSGAFGRSIESIKDLLMSLVYYVAFIFDVDFGVVPTVIEYAQIPFFDYGQIPFISPTKYSFILLPENWELFVADWYTFWDMFFVWDNFVKYLLFLTELLIPLSQILLTIVLIRLFLILLPKKGYEDEREDVVNYHKADDNVDSLPLRIFKRMSDFTYRPIKAWLVGMIDFAREHIGYVKWLIRIWLFNFHIYVIIVEAIAYVFYLIASLDFVSLYIQVYKLFVDLSVVLDFLPLVVWVAIIVGVLYWLSKRRGYKTLEHREAMNCGYINERAVVTTYAGTMGVGKTRTLVDVALSEQKILRDQAFEIIIESDLKFPFFPWINVERSLRQVMDCGAVVSHRQVRKWIRKKKSRYLKHGDSSRIFGYDISRYPLEYNDGLKVSDIWDVIEDYACAYFIYVIESSLLVSNFSVRTDDLLEDLGNFPLWNNDFFRRDPRLMDSYSRHSHIIDFDMLRLGKKLVENNPNAFAFGFGVFLISEIDKERKNDNELRSLGSKASDEECNQKNDLFNLLLMMSMHSCVIANRVFTRFVVDLQRPDSWGAAGRNLGEIVYIDSAKPMESCLPFYSPFYLLDLAVSWIYGKYVAKYYETRFERSDNTLMTYLMKGLFAPVWQYCERVRNTFNSGAITLMVESGINGGEMKKRKYYMQAKKIYSNRYATDCLEGIFDRYAEQNTIAIWDLPEYASTVATWQELDMQNSFFQRYLKLLR